MSAMQRNKGAAFERKVANLLTDATGTTWRRRVRNQAGDSDVVADEPAFAGISIECKHANVLCLSAWWRQAVEQAGLAGVPVLIYRQTGTRGEMVMVDAHDVNPKIFPVRGRHTVTLGWEAAMQWMREMLPAKVTYSPGII
ncbi:putative PDDEXK endonuclease [Achromobacter spanius]|uniref:putative PDDEXK endonuclease n=1 Tax=Achromobacter spanius TaxID=217203 RepID=UPI003207DC7F